VNRIAKALLLMLVATLLALPSAATANGFVTQPYRGRGQIQVDFRKGAEGYEWDRLHFHLRSCHLGSSEPVAGCDWTLIGFSQVTFTGCLPHFTTPPSFPHYTVFHQGQSNGSLSLTSDEPGLVSSHTLLTSRISVCWYVRVDGGADRHLVAETHFH
jgi:hypothetical protein